MEGNVSPASHPRMSSREGFKHCGGGSADSGMDASGWVALPDLLARLQCKPTEEEVLHVIETNEKAWSILMPPADLHRHS